MTLAIEKWIDKPNIAAEIDENTLNLLGGQVVDDWQVDLQSREKWEKLTEDGLDLAMQVIEKKTWPWSGAANVKYPLIAFAAIQFHARAYPEIIRGNDVVKGKVIGRDEDGSKEDRAERISKHMSYQVLEEMEEWEEDTDRLLMMLPIIGTLFKKTYFCPIRQRNVSCLRKPLDIVVHNDAKSVDDARRITDQGVWLYRNDIHERKAGGLFIDKDISYEHDEDKQLAEQFLEQHRWIDLDNDGYEEPYIVTVHRHSRQVVRVVARYDQESIYVNGAEKLQKIEPIQYFTKFSFLPSFDGGFYDVGFGQLLMPLNEAINTNLNQLLDAGTLANVQGGLVSRGIKIKGGQYRFQPGEWKQTDAAPQELKDGFFPLPTKEPSTVLFQLLSFLVEAGKQLASVSDIMTGEQSNPNEPATSVIARIEQGLKVFNGIHKRIYRSLKAEYKKLADLNRKYLDDEYYFRVLDIENVALREDYNDKDVDVVPVADPAQGTELQRLAKAQALLPLSGATGVDGWEVTRRYLEALNVANIDQIQPKEGKEASQQPPQDPKVIEVQGKLAIEQEKLMQAGEKLAADIALIDAQIEKTRAEGMKALADAEAVQLGPQLEYYRQALDRLGAELDTLRSPQPTGEDTDDNGNAGIDSGELQRMEDAPDDGSGIPGLEDLPPGAVGEIDALPDGGADLERDGIKGGAIAGARLPVDDGSGGLM